MPAESRSEVEVLRDEVDKLSKVITEVMGEEFDSIMARQLENQQSTLRWFVQSLSVSVAMMQMLIERGVLDEEECRERIRAIRDRLLSHAESIGNDADLSSFIDPN